VIDRLPGEEFTEVVGALGDRIMLAEGDAA
jgi:hypothetical protein